MSETPAEKKIDIDMLVKEWSCDDESKESKVLSTTIQEKERSMVGGDFVVNEKGEAVTFAFSFKGRDEKNYGLTVCHIWEGVDDADYSFSSNISNPTTGKLPLKQIGKVVTLSKQTDSMIFEFLPDANMDLYKVMIGPTTVLDLADIDWSLLSRKITIESGMKLCGFGAQRRGSAGIVIGRFGGNDHRTLRENDIGIESFDANGDEGKEMISRDVDCGMIYFHEQGLPFCMHHGLTVSGKGTANETYRSWGVPLDSVVEAHREYFGVEEPKPSKYVVVGYGATRFYNVEFPPGEEPDPNKYVVVGSGAARFNVEFLPGEEPNPNKYGMVGSGTSRFANVESSLDDKTLELDNRK